MLKAHVLNDQICAHSNNAAHSIEVPAGARLLFCNGQVGAHKDGTVPKYPTEQIEVIFERIRTILVAAHMAWHDIVKLTVYVTDKAIISDFLEARARHLGDHNPPAILLLVDSFPRPGVKVEIEAVAARVD